MTHRKKAKTVKKDGHPKPEDDGSKKETTNRHVYIEPGAKIDFVDDLKHKYETAQGDDNAHKINQLRWTKIAAGLVLLTAGFAGWQGWSTRKAANATARAADTADRNFTFTQSEFRMEQRPYLSAEGIGGFPEIGNDGKATGRRIAFETGTFKAFVIVRNIGKSPAKNVLMTDMKYAYGPRDEVREKIKKYVPKYPDIPHLITMESYLSPILPNPDHFEISKDDIPKYASGESEFYILGAVRYTDIFSPDIPPYETTYCYKLNLSGMPFAECNWEAPYFTNSIK